MDFLRLILLVSLLAYGAIVTHHSRELIYAQHEAGAVRYLDLTDEDRVYIKHLAGLATVQPASILVQDGMLLGTGLDHQDQFDPTAHAETEAIRDACRQAKKTVLKDGVLYASRQPCAMCMHVIAHTGIIKVVIGSDSSNARSIRIRESN